MSSYYERKKKAGMKFRVSFIFLFILASFAVCFILYMKSDAEPEPEPAEGTAEVTVISSDTAVSGSETEPLTPSNINPVPENIKLDSSYFDRCMFAGDSLMVGLSSYGLMPEERVAAGIGMSVISINDTPLTSADGTEILAADKINDAAPEILYIMLGLNMMDIYTNDQLLASYGDFIDSINRDVTDIYIISVPPVTAARETDETKPILNSDIDSFNSALLKFANNKGVYYLDLNTALKGADGRLPEEYAEKDGIHFKKSTYSIMLDFLLTHVYLGSR